MYYTKCSQFLISMMWIVICAEIRDTPPKYVTGLMHIMDIRSLCCCSYGNLVEHQMFSLKCEVSSVTLCLLPVGKKKLYKFA